MRWLFAAVVSIGLVSYAHAEAPDRRVDEHSYAEPTRVRIKDLILDLRVDFRAKRIAGTATLVLDWLDPAHRQLVLDTRDLRIEKIEGRAGGTWKPLKYRLAKRDATLGSALVIQADPSHSHVRIAYRTGPVASGLQWLAPAQTADGKQPFMFSQSQAIHARSWVPLQDTPGVRFTYSAHIRTPTDLVAVMSADNEPDVVRDGTYSFRMPQPIPSYLMALAVGDLVFKPISERAGVWAERSVIDKAVAEFADTEKMIVATEGLYGPYRWGRYDLLILPASFPFGGMENPRLSFITPTIIAGDKSLVSLIAHELAHSWSGNLVTNASWKDVWLNEGVTSYVESRITEAIYGRELADIESVLSQNSLRETVKEAPSARQKLRVPASTGEDPDGMTDVAYTKGSWFMLTLEQRFGRALFDPFLRRWFDQHAFQSVTTEDFVAYLRSELIPKRPEAISEAELADWLDGAGIPKSAVATTSAKLAAIDLARKRWLDGGTKLGELGAARWGTHERVHFLEGMPETLPGEKLTELDRDLALTGTANVEVAERWYPLAIRSGYTEARPAFLAFVQRIGRMKLIIPIYRALAETPAGRRLAERTLAKARASYHPLTISGIRRAIDEAAKQARKPKPKR